MSDTKVSIYRDRLDALVAAKLAAGIPAGGRAMLAESQDLVPVDTGNLRDSLTLDEDGGSATVSTDVPYALAVEFGSARQAAQPYMRPAAQAGLDAALEGMRE